MTRQKAEPKITPGQNGLKKDHDTSRKPFPRTLRTSLAIFSRLSQPPPSHLGAPEPAASLASPERARADAELQQKSKSRCLNPLPPWGHGKEDARSTASHGHGHGWDRAAKTQLHFKSARIYYLLAGKVSPLNLPSEGKARRKHLGAGRREKAAITLCVTTNSSFALRHLHPGLGGPCQRKLWKTRSQQNPPPRPPHHFFPFAFPTRPTPVRNDHGIARRGISASRIPAGVSWWGEMGAPLF